MSPSSGQIAEYNLFGVDNEAEVRLLRAAAETLFCFNKERL